MQQSKAAGPSTQTHMRPHERVDDCVLGVMEYKWTMKSTSYVVVACA